MKIAILNESKQGLGGGWSFIRNFTKDLNKDKITGDIDQGDIFLIPSASMVSRDLVEKVKAKNKKVVLRIDNIPRNSRNRGTGTSRLYDIAQLADGVIYQSEWARDYVMPFIGKYGKIIYNGIDTTIFNTSDETKKDFGFYDNIYLYSRYNRDETKGWERAWYEYQMIHRTAKAKGESTKLVIVGRFSDELRQYNFDFYNGENIEYIGIAEDPKQMAQILRGCHVLLAPYFNDAYSNTIQEAMACGLRLQVEMSGGTPEIIKNGVIDSREMVNNYIAYFNELLS